MMKLTRPTVVPTIIAHAEADIVVDREIGQHRRDETTPDRALMVAEAGRRRAYLGREALGQIARVLSVDRTTEQPLQREADRRSSGSRW